MPPSFSRLSLSSNSEQSCPHVRRTACEDQSDGSCQEPNITGAASTSDGVGQDGPDDVPDELSPFFSSNQEQSPCMGTNLSRR
jgi:hypothetical protein